MKFLVVDDYKTMRRIFTAQLNEMGHHDVEEAEDGAIALKKLREEKIDFVISDWNMPNLSGLELLQAVRSDEKLKTLPFILVTTESQWSEISRALRADVSDYLIKPFHPDSLVEKVNKCLAAMQG